MKGATYLVELDDVRMSDYLQDVDLSRHPVDIRLVLDLVFLKNLDGDLLACDQMRAEAHLTESALAERATYMCKKILSQDG